jgi:hypothetical protein
MLLRVEAGAGRGRLGVRRADEGVQVVRRGGGMRVAAAAVPAPMPVPRVRGGHLACPVCAASKNASLHVLIS